MNEYAIEELLPHAGNMMLLERVLDFDEESMTAEVIVCADGLFGDGADVPAWLGIEYMAQTIAAHTGMMCKLAGKPLNVGFLLGTRRYQCNVAAFKEGDVLTVNVKKLIQDQGLGVFECCIRGEGVAISAKLNVYQPKQVLRRAG